MTFYKASFREGKIDLPTLRAATDIWDATGIMQACIDGQLHNYVKLTG